QDVLKALQYMQKQPQVGETFADLITTRFTETRVDGQVVLEGDVTPQMTNHFGMMATGVLTQVIEEAARRALRQHKKGEFVCENLSVYFLKPIQIDSAIDVHPRVLEVSRKFGKVDVEVYREGQLVAKAVLTAQLFER
nr:hypothetical protein [Bacillota bacterium]